MTIRRIERQSTLGRLEARAMSILPEAVEQDMESFPPPACTESTPP
jgi:hypothetical protein